MPGLFKSKVTQKSTQSGNQSQTTTPVENPQYQGISNLLMDYFTGKMTAPTSLPTGYETGGIGNINNTYDLINQKISNDMTSRGLGRSPVAGSALARADIARGGDIAGFQSNLPMLERQLQQEDLANVLRFYFARPLGSTSTGSYSGRSDSEQAYSPSLFSSLMGVAGLATGLFGGLGGGVAGSVQAPQSASLPLGNGNWQKYKGLIPGL